MVTLVITDPHGVRRTVSFEVDREVSIGCDAERDLVLDDRQASRLHATMRFSLGNALIGDLRSANGTFVNGMRIPEARPTIISFNDEVQIGGHRITFQLTDLEPTTAYHRPYEPVDPVEEELIAAVVQRHVASREVYADWLEHRGDTVRAEFLHVQEQLVAMEPGASQFEATSRRLEDLAAMIDVGWRVAVARPTIEHCGVAFDFVCPKEWGSLAPTDRPNVRFCNGCNKNVYYCVDLSSARQRAAQRECVALDVSTRPLAGTCRMCGGVALGPQQCLRCGEPVGDPRLIREVMGKIASR